MIEIVKSRGGEKCVPRRFKEESEFRCRYVKLVVSYGRDLGGVVQGMVGTVGSEPAGEVKLGHQCAGETFCELVVRHRHY